MLWWIVVMTMHVKRKCCTRAHLRGLDMATLNLRGSVTKPSLPCLLHLTVEMMITSASLPYIISPQFTEGIPNYDWQAF